MNKLINDIIKQVKKLTKEQLLIGVAFVSAILIILSILSFNAYDSTFFVSKLNYPPENWLGYPGAFISSVFFLIFGKSAYISVILIIIGFIAWFTPLKKYIKARQLASLILAMIIYSIMLSFWSPEKNSVETGGILGLIITKLLVKVTGIFGFSVFIAALFILLLMGVFNQNFTVFQKFITRLMPLYNSIRSSIKIKKMVVPENKKPPFFQKVKIRKKEQPMPALQNFSRPILLLPDVKIIDQTTNDDSDDNQDDNAFGDEDIDIQREIKNNQVEDSNNSSDIKDIEIEEDLVTVNPFANIVEHPVNIIQRNFEASNENTLPNVQLKKNDINQINEILEHPMDSQVPLINKSFSSKASIEIELEKSPLAGLNIESYIFKNYTDKAPSESSRKLNKDTRDSIIAANAYNNLHISPSSDNDDYEYGQEPNPSKNQAGYVFNELSKSSAIPEEEYLSDTKKAIQILQKTLKDFSIDAEISGISRGPVITRYELMLAPGIKLNRITALADNLAYSLAASKIRIVAPIPGKSAIGVEIPNKKRETVTFGDIIAEADLKEKNPYRLPLIIGKDIAGRVKIADLTQMPHLLIAGSTGSGKSVCVNTLICSLLYAKGLKNVRFIMVDPKIVELKPYNHIPHLLAPVITEAPKASMALRWAVNEMERRYQLLDSYNTRDIRGFNKKIKLMRKNKIVADEYLPYIVVVIDEFADLMMLSAKEVEELIARLAAMSRAVGIHLILATQRPSADVITGLIKANFPARIAFQVSSKVESRIILDANGAESLLGKGDLLFTAPGFDLMTRIQGAYLSEEEVGKITQYIRGMGEPEYVEDMFDTEVTNAEGYSVDDEPLWKEACQIVVNERRASASYLQRKMKIGYNRAARIIELMESEGIVGPGQGSKPRDVLVDNLTF